MPFFQKMITEHGTVEKFLTLQEAITEKLTDPNKVIIKYKKNTGPESR